MTSFFTIVLNKSKMCNLLSSTDLSNVNFSCNFENLLTALNELSKNSHILNSACTKPFLYHTDNTYVHIQHGHGY